MFGTWECKTEELRKTYEWKECDIAKQRIGKTGEWKGRGVWNTGIQIIERGTHHTDKNISVLNDILVDMNFLIFTR
jgi:hypothetical protein